MNMEKVKAHVCLMAIAVLLVGGGGVPLANGQQRNPDMDRFIKELMGQMTIDEKIGQLNLVTAGVGTKGVVVSTEEEDKTKEGSIHGYFMMKATKRPTADKEMRSPTSRQST